MSSADVVPVPTEISKEMVVMAKAKRRKRLGANVTDREQLSLSTEGLPDPKENQSRDSLKAPVRRRSSVRARSDPPPEPSPATRAPTLKAPRSKESQGVTGCSLYTRSKSSVQHAPQHTRLTLAQLVEFAKWGKSVRDRRLEARGENHDETARSERERGRSERGQDPGASAVRGGPDSRPPRDQALPPADPGAKR